MVVRSNGCFACKRRRIKCDQARPSCKRCAVHRIPCPGYPSESANPINIVVYGSPTSSSQSNHSRHHELIPLQVNSAAHKRMQLIASAADGFVPFGATPVVPLDLMDISRFNTVSIRQPALDAATYALALVQLGTTSNSAELQVQGQREYQRSLRLLSSYITRSQSSKVWDQQVASAIVVLTFCEHFEALRPFRPISIHHIGLRSFYLNRGPVALRDHAESILFCQARSVILSGDIAQRRKCFFEEAAWLTVSRTAPGRDSFFELIDIGVRLPGIAELADSSMKSADERSIRDVLSQLEYFIDELEEFATRSWPRTSAASTEAQSLESDGWLNPNANLGSAYHFPTWRSANMYCTWAMICLFTRLELQRLLRSSPRNMLVPENTQRNDEIEADIVRNLEDLCRGIPSQIGAHPHSMGIVCSMGMLDVASKLLEQRGRLAEAEWCRSVLDRLSSHGFHPLRRTLGHQDTNRGLIVASVD